MFLRRKPGSLPFLDLQEIYNDVCANTIKNHELEASDRMEEALKGWKSLHTTLLYKIDVYEKYNSKMSPEELDMVNELKAIRDENVRHLIRILVLVDERNAGPKRTPATLSSQAQVSHKLSVSSLRPGNLLDRTLNGNSQLRGMHRTLRNNPQKQPTSKSDIIQAAANISWGLPKPVRSKSPDQSLFADFDQIELLAANWQRFSPGGSASSSAGSTQSLNLIDLDDDDLLLRDEDSDDGYMLRNPYENLSLNVSLARGSPPPIPLKSRTLQSSVLRSKELPEKSKTQTLARPNMSKQPSNGKLPPHIRELVLTREPEHSREPVNIREPASNREPVSTKKKYTYTKPKPMNVHEIMLKGKSKSDLRLATARSVTKSSAAKVATSLAKPTITARDLVPQSKGLNISYNYKPLDMAVGLACQRPKVVIKKKMGSSSDIPVKTAASCQKTLSGSNTKKSEDETMFENLGPDTATNGPENPADEQAALIKSIKGIDETAATQILNDIIVRGDPVFWDDVVGLENAKKSLKEAVVYPFLRPDLFRGLREPTRGMLLFGPPGTGKTMLARAVATESKSTFFSIGSSSLTSKYLGESEKLVKALFLLSRKLSPSIVFIDEIDSILGQRTEGENDSMRRIKNEFLVLWSELSSAAAGRDSSDGDVSRVLILGATNMPWAIDEAARRRFAKRVYIPLPDREIRKKQIIKLLELQNHTLLDGDFEKLMDLTEGFSGSDITLLAKDSAMGPLRSLGDRLLSTSTEDIRAIQLYDFVESLKYVRPSVSQEGLEEYENWVTKFGSSGA